jgi:cell wall-associated NlpC family hydrolase|uniref:NlpC/P60 family protein n=1 Tax=Desulfobacca acetoxidans TaxID=60893 RepID=A0A7C3WTI4_9BACT
MMGKFLGTVISLALIFSPQLTQAAPTKKKIVNSGKLVKKTKKTTTKSYSKSRSPRKFRDYGNYDRISPGAESVSRASVTGVGETPPLMRVIPQRDGRFLLEPLKAPKDLRLTGPTSKLEEKPAPASRGYNKFEPWNFQDLILTRAKAYCGAPYARGASLAHSSATDCSGFVQYIYEGFKINLPRSSSEQAQVGRVVTHNMDFSKLVPGDLLFFRRGGRHVGHAGIYLGEGKMIHASSSRSGGVVITDLREPYYQNTFVVAKRIFEVKYPDW